MPCPPPSRSLLLQEGQPLVAFHAGTARVLTANGVAVQPLLRSVTVSIAGHQLQDRATVLPVPSRAELEAHVRQAAAEQGVPQCVASLAMGAAVRRLQRDARCVLVPVQCISLLSQHGIRFSTG